MPGPGGGGHGGGGGRGGGFGGGGGFHGGGGHGPGFGGGGFHGGHHPPHHPHHHRPFYGGWHFGGWYPRRHYYGGGGCLGALMAPVILVFVLLVFLLSMCQNGLDVNVNNGYDEELFQDYADDQYALHFSQSSAYEDNLLIVVLTTENNSDFYYMAWVGDHIATPINHMMGNNTTVLGRTMNNCINESNYKYSLDSNLADMMNTMTREVLALGLESSFTCNESHSVMTADLVNHTELPMTEATVEDALERFASATGIPTAIVVEDMEDVFGKGFSGISLVTLVLVAVVVIIVIVSISKSRRRATEVEGPESTRRYDDDEGY